VSHFAHVLVAIRIAAVEARHLGAHLHARAAIRRDDHPSLEVMGDAPHLVQLVRDGISQGAFPNVKDGRHRLFRAGGDRGREESDEGHGARQ